MGGSRFLKGSIALHWNGGESDDSGDRASPFEKLHLNQSDRCAGSHWGHQSILDHELASDTAVCKLASVLVAENT